MTAGESSSPAPGRPRLALLITFSAQTLASLALNAPSVLAPVVAPLLGHAPERVGVLVAIMYFAAMASGLALGERIPVVGAVRITQWAMAAAGLGLGLLASGTSVMLIAAALAIGFAYGLTNPSAAELLGRHAPARRRGLYFSIKQTSVPAGIALVGLLAPALYRAFGWQVALAVLGALCCVLMAVLQSAVGPFDGSVSGPHALPARRAWWRQVAAPLAVVLRSPPLRRLGFVSFAYALTQICFLTFVVSMLKIEHGMSLAAAAGVLAAAQLMSIAGRIFWGHVADQWISPSRLLGVLGLMMGAALLWLALLPRPVGLVHASLVALACAATAVGWNGVYFAEMARLARPHEMAMVTGGTQFITFFGGMIGPALFSQGVALSGTYVVAFLALAALPVTAGVLMLTVRDPPAAL